MSVARGGRVVLKEDEVFVVCNERGNITATQAGAGLYLRDIRYLSLYNLTVNGEAYALLSSTAERIYLGQVHASARPARADGVTIMPQTISVTRRRIIRQGLREEIELRNYNQYAVPLRLTIELAADFRDMFEIRGFRRGKVGRLVPPAIADEGRRVVLGYRTADARQLETEVEFDRVPAAQTVHGVAEIVTAREPYGEELVLLLPSHERFEAAPLPRRPAIVETHFDLTLPPGGAERLGLSLVPSELDVAPPAPATTPFVVAVRDAEARFGAWAAATTAVATDNAQFDAFLERGARDIHALLTHFPGGELLAAGIPWYVAPFGRDSLIAAYQTLMLQPRLAVETLRYLARFQARTYDGWRDAEPGKILHEMRVGEMARLGDVPHTPYYGTIDATPLYVMLFAATVRWLDDDALFQELLPAVKRCLEWIDRYGDRDGDGYVEYGTRSRRGIANQGWKDSYDSILWPDGSQPAPPIALAEVQGYVYAAKRWLAALLVERGEAAWAARLEAEAADLKARFNRDFWRPEARTFGMGLDGHKRLVPAMTTNPGHGLLCGIVEDDKIAPLVARLLAPDMDGGWGLRTLSADEPQYNPMSYHNGTVWPHDNSLVVAGMRCCGYAAEANRVIGEIFDAAKTFRYSRLPELYCGFPRDPALDPAPAEYPVSCSPQAWAAGAGFLFLQTILGLEAGPGRNEVTLAPYLPGWLGQLHLRRLRVGRGAVELLIRRRDPAGRATVDVLDVTGEVRVRTREP
ncbi:MAG TPA: glycogen debranching N-terminal domain-containing protein [Thermomicrobiales bacterium]|nr:glycogen debranching N-terminal domain-containing protein [Thermomicrobiales bacterium]